MFDQNNIKLEAEVHPGGTSNTNQFQDLLNKVNNSVCRILLGNKGYGTGFFCKIKDPKDEDKILKVLFTCNHVLNKEALTNSKYIDLEINNVKIQLNIKNRKIWTNNDFNLDYTCVEILKNDNLNYFLNVDENIIDYNYSIEQYKNKGIYIFGIMKDFQLGFDTGFIQNVENTFISYNCNTDPGCSGGVIINKLNNSVIGIHKGGEKNKVFNMGIYMRAIIDDIRKNNCIFNNKVYNFKVIFIGDYGTRKEDIIRRIVDDYDDYRVDFQSIKIKINENTIHLWIFDTCGKEEYLYMIPAYYRGADCVILVYDITNKNTFQNIDNIWLVEIVKHCPKKILKILIGNSSHLETQREVSYLEGQNFANLNKMAFFEFSPSSDSKTILEYIAGELIKLFPDKGEELDMSENEEEELSKPPIITKGKKKDCSIF